MDTEIGFMLTEINAIPRPPNNLKLMAKIKTLSRISKWLKGAIIVNVPEDIALCEYDCSKEQCLQGEWKTCKRRLQNLSERKRQATE